MMEKRLPLKWKKHLILPAFNLRSMEELESEIKRFDSRKYNWLS